MSFCLQGQKKFCFKVRRSIGADTFMFRTKGAKLIALKQPRPVWGCPSDNNRLWNDGVRGSLSLSLLCELLQRHTRWYAKPQWWLFLTWKEPQIYASKPETFQTELFSRPKLCFYKIHQYSSINGCLEESLSLGPKRKTVLKLTFTAKSPLCDKMPVTLFIFSLLFFFLIVSFFKTFTPLECLNKPLFFFYAFVPDKFHRKSRFVPRISH